MPLTFFPKGLSTAAASHTSAGLTVGNNTAAGDNDLDVKGNLYVGGTQTITGAVSVTGAVTGAVGSVYGAKACAYTVTLSSALSNATIAAPYTSYPEIVYLQSATANITRSIRVVLGEDSTGTAVATLTVGSATSAANTAYTTVGGTVITQGSAITITSAITATVNTGYLSVNFVAVAS